MAKKKIEIPTAKWAVPEQLEIPADTLRLRLDFYHQSVILTDYDNDSISSRNVSPVDIAKALASDISLDTGILPENTLFWRNTRIGPVYCMYEEPKIRTLTVHDELEKLLRYRMPLPGLLFLCLPNRAPWVYAVKSRPTSLRDKVYKAPFYNTYQDGFTCAGSNGYPADPPGIVQMFLASFFTRHLANDRKGCLRYRYGCILEKTGWQKRISFE